MSDSDATTVPATTPEVKRMAQQRVAEEKAKQGDKENDPSVSAAAKGQLPRRLQSTKILETQVKKSESTATLDYSTKTPKAAAVKSKAAPTQALPVEPGKIEQGTPTSRAVQQCLARSNTSDIEASQRQDAPKRKVVTSEDPLANTAAKKPKTIEATTAAAPAGAPKSAAAPAAKDAPPPPEDPGDDDDHDSSDESEERLRKERQVKAKKAAHARYMRFHRSLRSNLSI